MQFESMRISMAHINKLRDQNDALCEYEVQYDIH
jgi:hypothetical protein